jgi:acyl-coenzyme A thioesterase PaaI-like protein
MTKPHNSQIDSLQMHFAPNSICFGCGPANTKGLRINSYEDGENILCKWIPEQHHQAFPGMINGGIIGTLLDCHCNWTAAFRLMQKNQLPEIACTVTAEYTIKLLRPTPANCELLLSAKVSEYVGSDRAWIEGTLSANGKVTATCRGLFVAVKEGHPAFHRWG